MTSQITPDGFSPASRARSTAASVWPVRSSTPPAFAFSGKMWPGCTRSAGRAFGSIATWIVCARSCAEMPVVMPSRASTETVNAVWKGDSFFAAIRSRPELVAAVGRERQADQPAPVLGHEVDRLGRGELGREREVALVLAVLGVADHDHPAFADVLDRLLDGAERRAQGAHRSPAGAPPFSTYLANTSTSRFTAGPGSAEPSVVRSSVSGISDTEKPVSSTSVTVKGHAVHGDRALVDHVAQQLGGGGHAHHAGEAGLLGHASTSPIPSTWPCTTCPPSRSPARSGSSRFTSSPAASGPSELRSSVSAMRSAANEPRVRVARGEADAVHRDRVAAASSAASGVRTRSRAPGPACSIASTVPLSATSPVNISALTTR